jgi:hypothetical protein
LTVSLATPLLLFGADLRAVLRLTGSLSVAFLVGSFAVALASFAAFYGLSDPMHAVGVASNGDGWKLAAALVAKNVGGGMNYVAVCDTLGVSPAAFSAGIAADNVFAILYFPLTSFLGGAARTGDSRRGRLVFRQRRLGLARRRFDREPERVTRKRNEKRLGLARPRRRLFRRTGKRRRELRRRKRRLNPSPSGA